MAENQGEKGQSEARTRAAAGDGMPDRGQLDQGIADLVAAIHKSEADQPGLFDDGEEGEPVDLLEKATRKTVDQKKGRGRPPGATNRRSDALFDYMEARGYTNPGVILFQLANMDPVELLGQLTTVPITMEHADQVIKLLQLKQKAAADLMQYGYSKKPLQVETKAETLHLFVTGNMQQTGAAEIKSPLGNIVDYQDVNQSDPVRHDGKTSHDDSQVVGNAGESDD